MGTAVLVGLFQAIVLGIALLLLPLPYAFIPWIAALAIGISVIGLKFRRTCCPQCGDSIQLPWRKIGTDRLHYYCPRCDIDWQTTYTSGGYIG
jgi:hypothetical protein